MAGAALAMSMPLLLQRRATHAGRTIYAVGAAAAVAGLLMADNRTALFAALATGIVIAVAPSRSLRVSIWAPSVSPLLPVTFVAVVALVTQFASSSAFIRNAESIGSNVRVEVWSIVLEHLANPSVGDLIGYGYMGHVSSGVSAEYVPAVHGQIAVVPGVASHQTDLDIRVTTHNYVLQAILDHGYLGTVVLLLLLTAILRHLAREIGRFDEPVDRSMLALMLFMLLIGTTETVFAVYHAESFSLVLLVSIACLRQAQRVSTHEAPHSARPRAWRVAEAAAIGGRGQEVLQ
jgi:O-antigen ligase